MYGEFFFNHSAKISCHVLLLHSVDALTTFSTSKFEASLFTKCLIEHSEWGIVVSVCRLELLGRNFTHTHESLFDWNDTLFYLLDPVRLHSREGRHFWAGGAESSRFSFGCLRESSHSKNCAQLLIVLSNRWPVCIPASVFLQARLSVMANALL